MTAPTGPPRTQPAPLARQWYGVGVVAGVSGLGTLWYWLVEGFDFLDATYQTIITVSTVGFSEVEQLDTSGRIFTMVLIVVGVAAMVYALGGFAGMIIESSANRIRARRQERSLGQLSNHVLICGYGRVGVEVARLMPPSAQVAVIDIDDARVDAATVDGYTAIAGDCTLDETLVEAGIDRATRLIVCLSRDGDAISTVLSARSLSPDLHIVSRANVGSTRPKLRRAGADYVVSTIEMAAQRLVGDTIDPFIGSFLDAALHDPTITVSIKAATCGRDLTQEDILEIERQSRARVIGIHKPTGAAPLGAPVAEGDRVIAAGHPDELASFTALVASPHAG